MKFITVPVFWRKLLLMSFLPKRYPNVKYQYSWSDCLVKSSSRLFSEKNSGKIIGISSIAGDRGRVGSPVYNTSKAALNTYLESLRNRLTRKGIQVLTVKPGFVDTSMTKGMPGLFWLISPNTAAKTILKAAANGKENIYVPARWALVGLVIRMIPSFIFKN